MKTIGLAFLFLLISAINQSPIDEKYKKAFKYIQTAQRTQEFCREIGVDYSLVCITMLDSTGDSLVCITVSDSVVYLDNFFFLNDMIKFEYGDRFLHNKPLKDSLIVVEYQREFSTFFLPSLNDLASCKDAHLILFFSKPYRNTLTAELLPYYDKSDKSFSRIAQFIRALQFLFYFTPQDSIQKVFTVQFQYD